MISEISSNSFQSLFFQIYCDDFLAKWPGPGRSLRTRGFCLCLSRARASVAVFPHLMTCKPCGGCVHAYTETIVAAEVFPLVARVDRLSSVSRTLEVELQSSDRKRRSIENSVKTQSKDLSLKKFLESCQRTNVLKHLAFVLIELVDY